jgi:hypothetical protein
MMLKYFILVTFFIILLTEILFASFTLRIMTYNVLNYDGTGKNDWLKTVVESINADFIVLQEVVSQVSIDSFRIVVLDNQYATIPFHNGPTTDSHIFYNPYEIQLLSDNYIPTALRDIAEYKIRIPTTDDTLYIYSAHLKASSGTENEQLRLAEAQILRGHLDQHSPNTNFLLVGDLNLYRSSEPAYQELTQIITGGYGHLLDPINQPGNWHNNLSYTQIHTQSTRAESLPDDGASGGLDDRFDFILSSEAFLDNIDESSYTVLGNDGNHFNQSINSGMNTVVSPEIADALYLASDHLPVFADILFGVNPVVMLENDNFPQYFNLYQNYPNPFNSTTSIEFDLPKTSEVSLRILNTLGENITTLVSETLPAGNYKYQWSPSAEMASGIYLFQLSARSLTKQSGHSAVRAAGDYDIARKMVLIK